MTTKKTFFIAVLLSAIGLNASAQVQNQQVDEAHQRQQLEQAASTMIASNSLPQLYAGETEDVGPESIIHRAPRRQFVSASADEQWYYTDNMFLSDTHRHSVDVLVSTVQAALDPGPLNFLNGQLDPAVGYQHQWFSYNLASDGTVSAINPTTFTTNQINLNKLDFNVSTIYANAAWRWHEWQVNAGFNYLRLLDSGNYQEFYHELTPNWAVRRDLKFSDTRSLTLGYEGDYRFTDTASFPGPGGRQFNDRTDHGVVIVGNWQLGEHAILQPSYRFQYSHYLALRRDDYLNTFTLTLYMPINQRIALRAFASYSLMRTDGAFASNYESINAGAGVSFNVRF